MPDTDPALGTPPPFEPANVDDGQRGDITFFTAASAADPVRNWLAAFAPDATEEHHEDGSLEPLLAPSLILAALEGRGIAPTAEGRRTWSHLDAMLTTPHPHVYVGVSLGDDPGERFRLGLQRPAGGGSVPSAEMLPAVRATIARLRAGIAAVPALPPAPALRPFRTDEGGRSFAQLAARKGISVDPAAAAAVDALQAAANAEGEATAAGMRDGSVDVETAWERMQVGKRAWLIEAYRLVGGEAVTATLDRDAVPRDPPPEAPGWPYWLRAAVAWGKGFERGKGSYELLTAIQFLCAREDGRTALDAAYRRLDVAALSELAMITLLRTAFMSRSRLAEWEGFRERVRAELFARGNDGDRVLVGLGKPEAAPDDPAVGPGR